MHNNTQNNKANEQSDSEPLQLRPEAPDAAERCGAGRQCHQNIPEDAFSADRHVVAQEGLLVHKQKEREVGDWQ